MPRCPNCWSGVDALAGACPECGAPLGRGAARTRAVRSATIAGLAIVALGAAGWWWWLRPHATRADSQASPTAGTPAAPPASRPADPTGGEAASPAPRVPLAHWTWTAFQQPVIPPIAVASAPGTRLVAILSAFPTRAAPVLRGRDTPLEVVHADRLADLLILAPGSDPPSDITPRPVGSAAHFGRGATLTGLHADGTVATVTVTNRTADGRLELREPSTPGTALLDDAGAVVAIVRGEHEALPLDAVQAWLTAPPSESVAELQAELRRRDPDLLLADLHHLFGTDATPAQLRDAIANVAEAALRAGDRDRLTALGDAERQARRLLVRRLVADGDREAALTAARDALAHFPDDTGLLEDAALLAADAGDSAQAGMWFARLRALDPAGADAAAGAFANALAAAARRLGASGHAIEALAALDQALSAQSGRGDLHAARARTLDGLGRRADALTAARQAAALDPAYQPLADDLAEAVARAGDPDVVEIPFDPQTHAIRTTVSAGGIPIELVVDTGATTTIIPVAVADRLGLRDPGNRRVRVETAGGPVEGEVVRLPTLSIGAAELRGVEAVALDLPGRLAGSGLLGMNALSRFRVEIDAEHGRLVLRRRTDSK